MCLFITGVLPDGADLDAVRSIAGPEGAAWRLADDEALDAQLPRGMRSYDLTGSTCDCHSILGSARSRDPRREPRLPKASAKWSETKKSRWLEQKHLVSAGKEAVVHGNAHAWKRYLNQLVRVVPQGPVGVLIHYYATNEPFPITVAAPIPVDHLEPERLLTMEEDTLYRFVLR